MTIEEIKQCTNYAEAIKVIFNKDYTNGRLQKSAVE